MLKQHPLPDRTSSIATPSTDVFERDTASAYLTKLPIAITKLQL